MSSLQTISEYMAQDHDRLDGLLAEFKRLEHEEPDRAKELFRSFRDGLVKHIAWEEQLLFPLFETRMQISGGPTEVMRMEHGQIREYLDRILSGREDDVGQAVEWLEMVLCGHNEKEENILYPWIDQAVPEDDRRNVLEKMRADASSV